MTSAFHTAQIVAQNLGRGCTWTTIAAPDLTPAQVANLPTLDVAEVDIVLVSLGVADVLLATGAAVWAANLEKLVEHLRSRAAPRCRFIFAGIPPMADFRPIPALARKMLMLQIDRLNGVTQELASRASDASFVPSPDWRVGDKYVQDVLSWKSLHKMWAGVLSAETIRVMDKASPSRPASSSDSHEAT